MVVRVFGNHLPPMMLYSVFYVVVSFFSKFFFVLKKLYIFAIGNIKVVL